MKRILPYFRGSRLIGLLAPLFKMTEATLELIVPLVIAKLIDEGIASGNKEYIFKLCILLVVLGFVGLLLSFTAQYFAAAASVSFVKRLKTAVYKKIQSLSFSQYDKIGSGTLITRLTGDMDSVQNGVNLTLRLLLRSPFVVIGACIMAFRVDPGSAVNFAVVVPLLSVVIFGIMLITMPLQKKVRKRLDGILVSAREGLTGARVLRAFNKEKEQAREFEENNGLLTETQLFSGRISALLNPLTCVIVNLGIAALIYTGALRVNSGIITCGAVVALYNYMSQILVELVKLANLIISITKSAACAVRIGEILDIEEETPPAPEKLTSDKAYLEFDNVSFRYPGSPEYTLENISFTAGKGERIGIIGSTGSGKTTLAQLIAGFYPVTDGNIFINGKNILAADKNELRSTIAFAEQKPVIFKGTVRSNLLYGDPDADDEKLLKALRTAQAEDFVLKKDGGLDAETEENGRNFSGGQRQRISLARALVKNAGILILDDVSSALDFATDAAMRRAVFENTDSLIFIISQRTGSIMNCDKIIVLDDGKATVGTHSQLLASNEVYREIHLTQFDEEEAAV